MRVPRRSNLAMLLVVGIAKCPRLALVGSTPPSEVHGVKDLFMG